MMETYTHSGKVPFIATILMMGGGLLAAILGGVIYAYLIRWIPIIYLNFLLTLGFGFGIGYMVGLGAKFGKARNNPVVILAALLCASIGLYVAWGATIWANGGTEYGMLVFEPAAIVSFMGFAYDNGLWTLSNTAVTGIPLAIVWIVEAGAILVLGYIGAHTVVGHQPFCESCNTWTNTEKGIRHFIATEHDPAWSRAAQGDLAALDSLPLGIAAMMYCQLDLATCPLCSENNYLSATVTKRTPNKKGEIQTKTDYIWRNLCISPEQVDFVRQCGQEVPAEEIEILPSEVANLGPNAASPPTSSKDTGPGPSLDEFKIKT